MLAQLSVAFAGIWLMVAPTVLDYAGLPADHDHVMGPMIASIGIVAAWEITRSLRWLNVVLGAWLIVAPFILGYEAAALLNSSLVGLLVFALSQVKGRCTHSFGGGWRSLLKKRNA